MLGASVEKTEFANFIQQENTKQNLRYSMAVVVSPGRELDQPRRDAVNIYIFKKQLHKIK